MKQSIYLLGLAVVSIWAKENLLVWQYKGVDVRLDDNKTVHIERNENPSCFDIPVRPEYMFGKSVDRVSSKCRRSVITTAGIIQPMQIDPQIRTVGELEVLAFLQKCQDHPKKYLVIDTRTPDWYLKMTIPGAVNLPYNEIGYDPDFPQEHQKMCKLLNINKTDRGYDFSKAKTVLLFCNGAWCTQSSKAIHTLMRLGYPKTKMLWYRGGLQDWLLMGFSGIKP